jgi:cyclohexa-1,5-dienecarbonyl-CoA hydratase
MSTVKLTIADGRAELVLDRPPVNVLDIAMMGEMCEALGEASEVPDLRVLVISAAGKAFSAGVDVGEHMGDMAPKMLRAFNGLIADILDFPLPTVALVKGAALGGGCELTLACDLVLSSDKATFGQPEVKVGVYPPPAVLLLPDLVGPRRASDLILTGRILKADEAREFGLVNHVFPLSDFDEKAEEIIAGMTSLSGTVLRKSVYVLREGGSFREASEELGKHYLEELMTTKDAMEGLTAFLEKRKPEWTHGK